MKKSFFELGGYSLLCVQLCSELKQKFNVDVKLHSIFENPTVSALAELVEGKTE